MKLYFLIGLPTETDEDVLGIAELARRCAEIGRRHTKAATVVASVGGFVPKPQTPFQWFGQVRRRTNCSAASGLLKDEFKSIKGVQLKWHDPKASAGRGHRRRAAIAAWAR